MAVEVDVEALRQLLEPFSNAPVVVPAGNPRWSGFVQRVEDVPQLVLVERHRVIVPGLAGVAFGSTGRGGYLPE